MIKYLEIVLLIAIAASLFRAHIAVKAFMYPEEKDKIPKYRKEWFAHQFIIHFLGSMLGWLSLIYIYMQVTTNVSPSIEIFLIVIFASLGIMGFLPLFLWNIAGSANQLVNFFQELSQKK